jgi:hypothetical protein
LVNPGLKAYALPRKLSALSAALLAAAVSLVPSGRLESIAYPAGVGIVAAVAFPELGASARRSVSRFAKKNSLFFFTGPPKESPTSLTSKRGVRVKPFRLLGSVTGISGLPCQY